MGASPTPSTSSSRSKVSRGWPVMESRPISPSTIPKPAMMSAFAIDPCAR